mmetsp:Transcript_21198/g.36173  ORF Transcript_21198/g.36173 Transcript_21198/m.36173 type:complete len:253 (-) Transcript_21198:899-1657(-)
MISITRGRIFVRDRISSACNRPNSSFPNLVFLTCRKENTICKSPVFKPPTSSLEKVKTLLGALRPEEDEDGAVDAFDDTLCPSPCNLLTIRAILSCDWANTVVWLKIFPVLSFLRNNNSGALPPSSGDTSLSSDLLLLLLLLSPWLLFLRAFSANRDGDLLLLVNAFSRSCSICFRRSLSLSCCSPFHDAVTEDDDRVLSCKVSLDRVFVRLPSPPPPPPPQSLPRLVSRPLLRLEDRHRSRSARVLLLDRG